MLTSNQDLPLEKRETKPWVRPAALAVSAAIKTVGKAFSPLDGLLAFEVVCTAVYEAWTGHGFTIGWYAIVALTFASTWKKHKKTASKANNKPV